jgi:replicative DNA helicase
MLEYEKAIIGHLVRFPETNLEVSEGLEAEDFSSPKLGAIFRAVQENSTRRYDALLLSKILKEWGWEVSVFDIVSLEEDAFDGVDLERVKAEIKAEAQKRNLTHYLNSRIKELEKPDSDLAGIHNDLSQKLLNLQAGISIDSILKRPSDFREEILDPKNSNAILTGLESFDRLFGGFRSHELTVLTGETSSGKTTLGTAFFPYVLSQKGHPVLIASFEMKPPQIQRKMIQMTIGRPFGDLSRSDKEHGLDLIEELPLHFIDAYGRMGLKELKGSIWKAHRRFGVELIVLDHLHYFLKYSPDQERQAIDGAMVELKSWAMALGVHIMLVVHPTKLTYDNKVVHLNDLKGSSGLKQIPDNVLSIWRPRGEDDLKKPQNEIILYVLKVRDDDGDEGKIILNFDKRSQSYSDSGPGFARPAEGRKGSGLSSPSSRPPERHWLNGYDS